MLHSAVAAHGKAKRELHEAQAARMNLHSAWRRFLAQSAQQWQQYSDMFMKQEQELAAKVQSAKESLVAAKESLNSSKSQAGLESKEDNAMSENEDLDKDLSAVTATKISEGFSQLSAGLQTLQQQAEQAEKEEQQAIKRQRVTPSEEAPAEARPTPLPFGGPA